jgi:Putative Flp pilus-assembly TadE/G-like
MIPGRNDGQSLVLFAIMIPVLLVFAAFVVDGAHAFVDRYTSFPRNRRFSARKVFAT